MHKPDKEAAECVVKWLNGLFLPLQDPVTRTQGLGFTESGRGTKIWNSSFIVVSVDSISRDSLDTPIYIYYNTLQKNEITQSRKIIKLFN